MRPGEIVTRIISQFWLLGNIAARSLLGLQLYAFAVVYIDPTESARLFQLLLLQFTIGIVMTGSGYVRGAAAQQRGEMKPALVGVLGLSLILVVGLIAADAFAGDKLRQIAPYDSGYIWAILMAGAGCGAIVTIIQGILAAAGHKKAAFLPGTIGAIGGAIYVVAVDVSMDSLLTAWCFYQFVSLILIAPLLVPLVGQDIASEKHMTVHQAMKEISMALQIGLFGAISMLAVYLFREKWRVEADAHVVELVFFALRFSDLFFQFVFYGFALGQMGRFAERVRNVDFRWGTASVAIWLAVIVASLFLIQGQPYALAFMVPVIVLHVGMDVARLVSSWACIDALRELTPLRYLLVTVVPYALGAALAWATVGLSHATALYIFLICAAVLQCVFAFMALDAPTGKARAETV